MVGFEYKPSDYIADANSEYFITLSSMSKPSDWQCTLIGGPNGAVYNPSEGNEPNWFHRKMQELILGFKWKKVK